MIQLILARFKMKLCIYPFHLSIIEHMADKFVSRGNPQMFEINVLAWLFELSRIAGRRISLGEVPREEWERLRSLGMDFVWLMGIWSRSAEGRKISLLDRGFHKIFDAILPGWTPADVVGSSYSISSHEPDPAVGTWEDIDRARAELRRLDMGLILDFIPNHTGVDHHWLTEHPEYFIQVDEADFLKDRQAYFRVERNGPPIYVAHGKDPNFPSWTDTAQINYFNPQARTAMIERLKKIPPTATAYAAIWPC